MPYENLILFCGTYSTGRVFPGRTGQQGLILPDLTCLPVLCHGALGYSPSTVNRGKCFILRYNSSEQVSEETIHCRHLKSGMVNPMLGVRCWSGANINVMYEKQQALPEEYLPLNWSSSAHPSASALSAFSSAICKERTSCGDMQ